MSRLLRSLLSRLIRDTRQDSDVPRLSLDNTPCTRDFAAWLRSHPEIETDAITRRTLLCLYAEYCDYFDLKPVTPGRLYRSVKAAGFERCRLSISGRPWVYRLKRRCETVQRKHTRTDEIRPLPKRRGR